MDEFEIIERCFRERATRRPGTVLGIGDDAALLDTGGRPLTHARATVPFSVGDDAGEIACRVFGAAFIRLAANAVTPRWATLGLTLDTSDPDWIEHLSTTTAAVCDACGVELIGGDTTRGPGRATVFALGTGNALSRRPVARPHTGAVMVRVSLATTNVPAPARVIADLVLACAELARCGAEIHCSDAPDTDGDNHALELIAHTDAAGISALRMIAGRWRLATTGVDADG